MGIQFTNHALYRIKRRKLSRDEVIDGIIQPNLILKKHGKYFYQKQLERGKIEIVCENKENNINIITIYWI